MLGGRGRGVGVGGWTGGMRFMGGRRLGGRGGEGVGVEGIKGR